MLFLENPQLISRGEIFMVVCLGFISLKNIYLFIWLHQVFVASSGFFHCGAQTLSLQHMCSRAGAQ